MPPAGAAAQDQEVLRTAKGVPIKLVVRRDAAIYEEPGRDSRSQPVEAFQVFYALTPVGPAGEPAPPGARTRDGYYAVTDRIPARNSMLVWVHRDDVVE